MDNSTDRQASILEKHAVKLTRNVADIDSFDWFPISSRFLEAVREIDPALLSQRSTAKFKKLAKQYVSRWAESSRPYLPVGINDADLFRMFLVNLSATTGSNLAAMVEAGKNDTAPAIMVDEDVDLKHLACFFRRLSNTHLAEGRDSFFMTFDKAGQLFGTTWTVMRGRMRWLEELGVLKCTERAKRGGRGRGSYYRFVEHPELADPVKEPPSPSTQPPMPEREPEALARLAERTRSEPKATPPTGLLPHKGQTSRLLHHRHNRSPHRSRSRLIHFNRSSPKLSTKTPSSLALREWSASNAINLATMAVRSIKPGWSYLLLHDLLRDAAMKT